MTSAPDLVIAGNLLVDDIVLPDGRTLMGEPGGAVLYGALAAALWDVRVAVVSVRGADYPAHALDALAARGVDLSGVHAESGANLRTWLLYEPHGRRVIHHLGTPDHARVSPTIRHFPGACLAARAVHLAPTPFTMQRDLVNALRTRRPDLHVALDPFEIVRPDNVATWAPVLAGVNTWFVSEDEIVAASDAEAVALLSRAVGGTFTGQVVRRLGRRGGEVLDGGDGCRAVHRWTTWLDRDAVDTTGAGDAFAAGFLAGRVRGEPVDRCCAMGVVSASFALDDWGPRGLLASNRAEALARLDRLSRRPTLG